MTIEKVNPKNEFFWIGNILFSALTLFLLYGILNTSFAFQAVLSFFLTDGNIVHFSNVNLLEKFLKAIFVYGRDFLWGYALVFSFCSLFHRDRVDIKLAAFITGIFEIVVVIFRISIIPTTSMNLFCLFAMAIGDLVALTIVLSHERYLV